MHSVLIIEDDPLFRENFTQAVLGATDLRLDGVAGDLPEGMLLLEQTVVDVLLLDIGLPSGSGIELIHLAKKRAPNCDVMVITVFGDEHNVIRCIEAGATGYLLKESKSLDIVNQIRTLRGGGSPVSPAIARKLLGRFTSKQHLNSETKRLSTQELTVLEMSSKGYSYDEISCLLGLSRNTIGTYVKRIYQKLHVHSKSQAIYEARKQGMLND